MVNSTRHFAYQLAALLPGEEYADNRAALTRLIVAYPSALRHHLRRQDPAETLRQLTEDAPHGLQPGDLSAADPQHIPNAIAAELYRRITAWNRDGVITKEMLINLNAELARFTDITGACERILKTPIPFGYNLFIKKFIFAYTITLPRPGRPIRVLVCAAQRLRAVRVRLLELIAEEIEDPFGMDANDLPTDALADTMRANVAELLVEGLPQSR